MQSLVTDRAHFKSIRESNSLYIDKTEFVYKIACSEENFFLLNRPRRFGKSLFVNTLKSFYQAEKDCRYISVSFDPKKREITELEIRS